MEKVGPSNSECHRIRFIAAQKVRQKKWERTHQSRGASDESEEGKCASNRDRVHKFISYDSLHKW